MSHLALVNSGWDVFEKKNEVAARELCSMNSVNASLSQKDLTYIANNWFLLSSHDQMISVMIR